MSLSSQKRKSPISLLTEVMAPSNWQNSQRASCLSPKPQGGEEEKKKKRRKWAEDFKDEYKIRIVLTLLLGVCVTSGKSL